MLRKSIIALLLLLSTLSLWAAKPKTETWTPEQEQQFRYYYYEAVRLSLAEAHEEAYQLFWFCYGLKEDDAMVNFYLGLYLSSLGHTDAALHFLKTAYTNNPKDCWFNYVNALLECNHRANYSEAVKVLRSVVKLNPKEERPWRVLANLYLNAYDFRNALSALDGLERVTGYDISNAYIRARIHSVRKDYQKALRDINRYLEQDESNIQMLLLKVDVLSQFKNHKELVPTFETILRYSPYEASVLNNYAYYLATHQGDLTRAEEMSRRAVQQEPSNPTFLDTYAWILYQRGEYSLAQFYIKMAVDACKSTENIPPVILQHRTLILKQTAK